MLEPKANVAPRIQLRDYQREAVDAAIDYLHNKEGNPVIEAATGAGKSVIVAALCEYVASKGGRVLVVTHVKELVEQLSDAIAAFDSEIDVGVYSAGLNQRDTGNAVIVAGIQSVYHRGAELYGQKPPALVIVDESHAIPTSGDGMYRGLISKLKTINPRLKIVGLTATPFRTGSGWICSPDSYLNEICYSISVSTLIERGFLSPIMCRDIKRGRAKTSGIKITNGDFDRSEMEDEFIKKSQIATQDLYEQTKDRRSVLVFCCGVKHADTVCGILNEIEPESAMIVTGDTASSERSDAIAGIRDGSIRFLVNVNVLTVGFDAPNIDAVVLLRSTLSPGLYVQMVGRGLRKCEGKDDCIVLDYGGNVMRHGPIDDLTIRADGKNAKKSQKSNSKKCKNCETINSLEEKFCICCEKEFSTPPVANHEEKPQDAPILAKQAAPKVRHDVKETIYSYHHPKDPSKLPTLKVTHMYNLFNSVSEWICIQHDGYARQKAEQWWAMYSNEPCPKSIDAAIMLAENGALAKTEWVEIQDDENGYKKVRNRGLGKKPEPRDPGMDDEAPMPRRWGMNGNPVPNPGENEYFDALNDLFEFEF